MLTVWRHLSHCVNAVATKNKAYVAIIAVFSDLCGPLKFYNKDFKQCNENNDNLTWHINKCTPVLVSNKWHVVLGRKFCGKIYTPLGGLGPFNFL